MTEEQLQDTEGDDEFPEACRNCPVLPSAADEMMTSPVNN